MFDIVNLFFFFFFNVGPSRSSFFLFFSTLQQDKKGGGKRERNMWYRRRESEKRVKVIYATCYCKLNVFLAWCFKSKKLKIKSILKICFQGWTSIQCHALPAAHASKNIKKIGSNKEINICLNTYFAKENIWVVIIIG